MKFVPLNSNGKICLQDDAFTILSLIFSFLENNSNNLHLLPRYANTFKLVFHLHSPPSMPEYNFVCFSLSFSTINSDVQLVIAHKLTKKKVKIHSG